jgi:hypothetical protein
MSGRIAESQWKKEMEDELGDLEILRKIKNERKKKGKKDRDN